MKSYFNTDIFDNLRNEFGHNFEEFLCLKSSQLEKEYKNWRLRRWLSDCFNDAKQNGSVVERCQVRTSTFNDLVIKQGISDFIPEEHAKIPGRVHNIGKLFDVEICVDDTMDKNRFVFNIKNGESKIYLFPFMVDHGRDMKFPDV